MSVVDTESLRPRTLFPREPCGSRVKAQVGTDGEHLEGFTSLDHALANRHALRGQVRRLRRSLTTRQRRARAKALARHLVRCTRVRRSEHIGCYIAQDGELDLAPAMARLRAMGKQLYLPVLRGPRLWFMPLEEQTQLVQNRFGIPEPDAHASTRCAPQSLDLLLAPLVAFDDSGHRLGMGGGYYDRTFAYLLHRQSWRRPHLIGVAYDLQRVPALTIRDWDVPLEGIATESGLHFFRAATRAIAPHGAG